MKETQIPERIFEGKTKRRKSVGKLQKRRGDSVDQDSAAWISKLEGVIDRSRCLQEGHSEG